MFPNRQALVRRWRASRFAEDRGQTIGIYIVAMAALFFLAFAYFAVGQAAVNRNSAQTAADAAALAAARETRDGVKDAFLAALKSGDTDTLTALLAGQGMDGTDGCAAAVEYADLNQADAAPCTPVHDPPGWTVAVKSRQSVGKSVVDGTEDIYATAQATAVVQARCTEPVAAPPDSVRFSCGDAGEVTVDPNDPNFTLDLSMFYSVHLTS